MKPTKTIVQTERFDEGGITRFEITHVGDITDALNEIRRCVKLWAKTAEGKTAEEKAAYKNASGDYNWGDLIQDDLDCKHLLIGHKTPIKLNRSIIKKITWETVLSDFRIEHDEWLMRGEF